MPLTVRGVDIEHAADLAMAHDVIVACELAALGFTDATEEGTRALLTGPDALHAAHLIALEGGSAVGLLAVEILEHGRELFLDAYAVGASATDLQRLLLERGLATARDVARERPAPGLPEGADPYPLSADIWQVIASGYEQDGDYRSVLDALGFRIIRRFWRMILDLGFTGAQDPPAPVGVTRRVVDGEADRRLMHHLYRDSFADHFGSSHDEPFEDWIASMEALPGNDPAQWWLALLDGDPVGLIVLDDSRAEFGEAYVRTIGVVRSARGRGIATWLLGCAAVDAKARGRTGLALSVDGENTTGATRLYESAGFTTRQLIDVWCYPLLDIDSSR